jgi:uncharacterized protein YndB with AHSA1/START domain/ketosteroid isomerase-like protein
MTTASAPTRHGFVERHGRSGSIRFERLLAHPVDRVWEAITTPEGLAAWWLPFDADITVDLVVGGLISFSSPDLGDSPMTCEVLEVAPPHRLVHSHFDRSVTLTWELEPSQGGCVLRLRQDTPDIAAALAQGHIIGLHHSLDRLEPALDGRPESWDWDRLPVIEKDYRSRLLESYVDGFRAGDHEAILDCLTDDVTWDIVGHATANGAEEFAKLIDGPEGASLPRLTVDRTVVEDEVIAAFGAGEFEDADGETHRFRYADSFTFRDGLISAVVSYVVPG